MPDQSPNPVSLSTSTPEAPRRKRSPEETRLKLIEATTRLMIRQGFNASGVDQICAEAGVTKGAFFHHFATKEELGLAALAAWSEMGSGFYATAYDDPGLDPLARVHLFLDIMVGFAQENPTALACLIGTLSQELGMTHPKMREACVDYLTHWAEFAERLLDEAKAVHPPAVPFCSREVSWFLNGVWQGSMLLNKTRQDSAHVITNLEHARAYLNYLFGYESPVPAARK